MKRFKVMANSTIMDAEVNVRYKDEAHEMFEKLRNSGKPYDADAFDAKGLPLQFYKTKG